MPQLNVDIALLKQQRDLIMSHVFNLDLSEEEWAMVDGFNALIGMIEEVLAHKGRVELCKSLD